jgi:hypothetical protein
LGAILGGILAVRLAVVQPVLTVDLRGVGLL